MPDVIVVAALIRSAGRVLISKRLQDGGPDSGKWEFPGGKVERGEKPEQALEREIMEELGIRIGVGKEYASVRVERGGRMIDLRAFMARKLDGEPSCLQCAEVKWVLPRELEGFDLAAADVEIARMLAAESAGRHA